MDPNVGAGIVEGLRVPVPTIDGLASETDYRMVRDATSALCWTLAEMDEFQIVPVIRYLQAALSKAPLLASPYHEPSRIVLGLFLLALRDIVMDLDPEAVPREMAPPWYLDAVAFVNAVPDEG